MTCYSSCSTLCMSSCVWLSLATYCVYYFIHWPIIHDWLAILMWHPLGVLDTLALNLHTLITTYAMYTFWTHQPLPPLRKVVDHLVIELWNSVSFTFDSDRKISREAPTLISYLSYINYISYIYYKFWLFTNFKLDF